MRLYNLLKSSLALTRNELSDFQNNHIVTVNDSIVPYSTILKDSDIVRVDGNIIKPTPLQYYLYYKPRGILSVISNKPESYIHHIPIKDKVTPAGRLDKDSSGLLILSNDGAFLNTITGDSSTLDKEYIITVKEKITNEFIEGMSKSYTMDNKATTPAKVTKIDDYHASVVLYEGLYHQVRRLVKINKYTLLELHRIRIGSYTIGTMKSGEIQVLEK